MVTTECCTGCHYTTVYCNNTIPFKTQDGRTDCAALDGGVSCTPKLVHVFAAEDLVVCPVWCTPGSRVVIRVQRRPDCTSSTSCPVLDGCVRACVRVARGGWCPERLVGRERGSPRTRELLVLCRFCVSSSVQGRIRVGADHGVDPSERRVVFSPWGGRALDQMAPRHPASSPPGKTERGIELPVRAGASIFSHRYLCRRVLGIHHRHGIVPCRAGHRAAVRVAGLGLLSSRVLLQKQRGAAEAVV